MSASTAITRMEDGSKNAVKILLEMDVVFALHIALKACLWNTGARMTPRRTITFASLDLRTAATHRTDKAKLFV